MTSIAGLRAGVGLLLGALVAGAGAVSAETLPADSTPGAHPAAVAVTAATRAPAPELPGGGRRIYPGHVLVAYYGTAGTGALGVLGEQPPDRITPRLRRAAGAFATPRRKVQVVYELIVTVADATPGPDGDYNHDIARAEVERYRRAAHRNQALLVLDLQPGRADFLTVAKRWRWALRDPWVGLALDPEWRMAPGRVPGRVIGQVGAREVNRVSAWLADLTERLDLPQKVFMLHQFRTDMVRDIGRVVDRDALAMIQHVDGFGTPSQKLTTYHTVARPDRFEMGFKLFYDEDTDLISPRRVLRIRPRVGFVSYQ